MLLADTLYGVEYSHPYSRRSNSEETGLSVLEGLIHILSYDRTYKERYNCGYNYEFPVLLVHKKPEIFLEIYT